jgi:hypothetical protein
MINRVAEVNRELRQRGIAERLTRGNGYYYFRDGDSTSWPATSVYVNRAADLSIERWLGEYEDLSGRKLDRGDCQWFALCDHPAVTTEPHPILGAVPICQRCADFVGRLK